MNVCHGIGDEDDLGGSCEICLKIFKYHLKGTESATPISMVPLNLFVAIVRRNIVALICWEITFGLILRFVTQAGGRK